MTGLPSLASHYSGVGMQATVKIYVKKAEHFILEVKSPKYVDINGELNTKESNADTMYGTASTNWRDLKLPPLKEVS